MKTTMKIKISEVFNQIEESATLAINQNIKHLRSEGKTIYHLGFGESPFPVPECVKKGLRSGESIKAYQPTQGIKELRESVSKFYSQWFKLNYSPEDIFIGPGSKELIFDLMHLIEGDLILPVPSWVSYIPQAKISGKKVIKVDTSIKNSYCMTVEELDKSYRAALKFGLNPTLMLINTPGNPCGNSYPEDLVKEIAEYARNKGIYIISDEIYGNIIFEGYNHSSFARYYPEGTFVTGGISKDRSLGGYRIGVCLVPEGQPEFKKAFNTLISETFSCVSAPIQQAAIPAYSLEDEMIEFINNCTKIHNIALDYFHKELIKSEYIECAPPMGAFYLYPKYNITKLNSATEISKILLEEYNVASLPSNCFGQEPDELNTRLAITDYNGSKAYEYYTSNPGINNDEFINICCPNLVKSSKLIREMVEKYA
ncbi:MAG: aminotransferase class I/II-fold pyridoxal phosphate-dependent enzyme [Cyanobacteriota bacterium]